ncbi:MAG: hypothetical protein ACRDTC_17995 [Pseudonocardiaceae bacterium]
MARKRLRPVVNTALECKISAAGWTLAAVAEAIDAVGAENNLTLTYGAAAVAHWLNGVAPRVDTRPIAVEAFARRLGLPELTATDLGWPAPGTGEAQADPWQGDSVVWLSRLGRNDMLDRRNALVSGLYSLAALTIPATLEGILRRSGPARRGGPGDVARIRETTRQFSDLDDRYGGGHARTAVAAYLVNDVVPLLRGTTGRARPALFRAACQLTYLAGWMAVDGGANGLGQRYYIQAVRLAGEAVDPLMRATVLRALAVQAIELGHATAALDLAEAAIASLRTGCPARTQAWITGVHAEALAATHDGWLARRALYRAERDLERADSQPGSEWIGNYRRESLDHQTGMALLHLGDLEQAEAHLSASAGSRQITERRSRALIGARLAVVQHRRGRRDAAGHTMAQIADDVVSVESARVRRELRTLPVDLLRGALPPSRDGAGAHVKIDR